jgi:hypothetical protein
VRRRDMEGIGFLMYRPAPSPFLLHTTHPYHGDSPNRTASNTIMCS